jgi:hypothetical protein
MNAIDTSEWWLVLTNGEWFAGRKKEDVLLNLQKVQITLGVKPVEGQARPFVQFLTAPWLIDSLSVPKGAVWIAVDALDNRVAAANMLAATEKLKIENRARKAGIHLA